MKFKFLHYILVNLMTIVEVLQFPLRVIFRLLGLTTFFGWETYWDSNLMVIWADKVMGVYRSGQREQILQEMRNELQKID